MRVPLCIFLTIFGVSSVISVNNLREEFSWTRIDYDWPTNRRVRRDEIKERYNEQMQNDESFYFPDSVPDRKKNNNFDNLVENGNKRPNYQEKPKGKPSNNHGTSQNNNQNSWGQLTQNDQNTQSNHGTPSRSQRRENYIYQNNIPMGAGVWGDKLFITVPRRRHGVPSSLNYVSLNSQNKRNTPLIPYPNWEMNALPDNYNTTNFDGDNLSPSQREKFVSVYRVAVDACDRLWFVDTGRLEIPDAAIQVQPPKLVIMDLRTDKVLRQYQFPDSDLRPGSLFAHVVVDTEPNNCQNAHAFIADVSGYGLVVYNFRQNRSWRVTHNYFYLEPLRGEFQVAGHTFQWNDGVFSTALSSPNANGRRHLYFHSMAGSHMYRVSTDILTNETSASRSYHGDDFENLGDRGERSQTSASALDESTGVLFLGLVNQNALACWNINSPLSEIDIVQKDDNRLIYPCDLKIYNNNIYFLTNTMPGFLYGQLDYDQVNFRIWVQNAREAIQGTRCARGGTRSDNFRGNSNGNRGTSGSSQNFNNNARDETRNTGSSNGNRGTSGGSQNFNNNARDETRNTGSSNGNRGTSGGYRGSSDSSRESFIGTSSIGSSQSYQNPRDSSSSYGGNSGRGSTIRKTGNEGGYGSSSREEGSSQNHHSPSRGSNSKGHYGGY